MKELEAQRPSWDTPETRDLPFGEMQGIHLQHEDDVLKAKIEKNMQLGSVRASNDEQCAQMLTFISGSGDLYLVL